MPRTENHSISISPHDRPAEARWRAESGKVVRCDHVVEAYWLLEIEAPHAAKWTGAGQFVGTLPYLSPEQAAGDATALDTRSDVYGLGSV